MLLSRAASCCPCTAAAHGTCTAPVLAVPPTIVRGAAGEVAEVRPAGVQVSAQPKVLHAMEQAASHA